MIVSEKINRAKPVRADLPDLYDMIENLDAAKLNIHFTGAEYSPTVVTGTEITESGREVKFLEPDDSLFPKIAEIIKESKAESAELKTIHLTESDGKNDYIWGIGLIDSSVTFEIASKISELANENGLNVRIIGNIEPGRLDGILCHEYTHLKGGGNEEIAAWISEGIKRAKPRYVIFPSTIDGREISANIAAKLELGLTADCIDLRLKDGKLLQYKPAFGGGIVASIISKTEPQMATVRP